MSPDRPNEPEGLTDAGEHDRRVSAGSELARLHDGYMLRYAASSKTLDLHAPDGQICVRLILGAQGAQVEISAASLAVERTVTSVSAVSASRSMPSEALICGLEVI